MIKEDYIMRIIHEMVRTILKLIFRIDEDKKEETVFEDTELQETYQKLLTLSREGRIEDAEDLLYESLPKEQEGFKLALLFYDHLTSYTEDELEEGGFSKEEISEGIMAAARKYGYEGMVSALLEKE